MIGKEKERGDLFMNKNLKRALNTTAAVSMSLAMVLGAVSPVSAAMPSGWEYNAVSNSTTFGKKVVESLGDVTSIALDEIVVVDKVSEVTLENFLTNATVATGADIANEKVAEVLKYSIDFGGSYTDDEKKAVKHLLDTVESVEKLLAAENALKTWFDAGSSVKETYTKASDKYNGKTYLEIFEEVEELMAFKGNVKTTDQAKLADIELHFEDLKEAVADYKVDNIDASVKKFVDALKKQPVAGKTVDVLVNTDEAVAYNQYSSVEAFIKKATKDSYEAGGVKYGDVKEEAEVVEYIEALEAVAADMKEAKQIVEKDSKDVKNAYKASIQSKVADLLSAVKSNADNAEDLIDEKINAFRKTEIDAVRNYVEEFVNEFWTVATVERSNGTYRTKWVDAGLGRYYALSNFNASVTGLMTELVDNEEETTYYDLLVGTTANVDKLIAAVTTDIEGITMESKLTNREAAKIIAAHKALNELGDKKDTNSIYLTLPLKERKAIDANRDLIEVLYFKLILNGEVTTVGWVETAKGWEYYDNNGNRVMEGWAAGKGYWSFMKNGYSVSNEWCAANDGWYYMGADGKMVTGKVVIDGVEQDFGTDGIWVR